MAGGGENCFECVRKENRGNFTSATSFFKVMIGNNFSKILYLPPLFAPTVTSLTNQTTLLDDSNGKKWRVKVCHVDGSLAFTRGWDSFSTAHGLQLGDFLVFHYIIGSHFAVKVYTNSACEKLTFNYEEKRPGGVFVLDKGNYVTGGKKHRSSTVGSSSASDAAVQSQSTNRVIVPNKPAAVSNVDELSHHMMVNRDLMSGNCNGEEDMRRRSMLDLSFTEISNQIVIHQQQQETLLPLNVSTDNHISY